MRESIRRALRTTFQSFLGYIIMEGGISLTKQDFMLLRPAAGAAITGLIVWVHNTLEDKMPSIDTRGLPTVRKGKKVR